MGPRKKKDVLHANVPPPPPPSSRSLSLLERPDIPPHNRAATTAADAYRMEDIVPASIRDALDIRALFPALDKPAYREELRESKRFGEGYVLSRLGGLRTDDKQVHAWVGG